MVRRKPVWLARFGATVLAVSLALPAVAGKDVPTADAFARLKPGKTKRAQVYKAVGKPVREYGRSSPAGTTPVYVTYLQPGNDTGLVGSDDPFTASERAEPTATPMETTTFTGPGQHLTVLEYASDDGVQPFYVVLKDDVVFYAIAPVPSTEKSLGSVQKKYGKSAPDLEKSPYRADRGRQLEVYAYPSAAVAFLREPGAEAFSAKVIGFKKSR